MKSSFFRSVRFLELDGFSHHAVGLGCAAVLLGCWFAWFLLAQIAVYESTDAAGLEVGRAAHPVDAPIAGRVVAIHLELGRPVKAGEVLVELDTTSQQLELNEERTQAAALNPQIAAIRAQIAAEQRACEEERRASEVALDEARSHYREGAAAAHFAEDEESRLHKMYDAAIASALDLRKAKNEAQQRRAAADALRFAMSKQEQEQHTRQSDRQSHIQQLRSEVEKLEGQRATAEASIQRLQDAISRQAIRAAVDGRLGEIANLKPGSVVHVGENLADIIPSGSLHVVANFLPPAALGRIHPGQRARLRLTGFPWAQFGGVTATVTSVASEVRDGRVRVELALDRNPGSRIPLQHGLPGTVEVLVERISPASMVLRIAGRLLSEPHSMYPDQRASNTPGVQQ